MSSLEWLHLNNNSLSGELPLALRNCTRLIVLNLGENGLSGNIPRWIGESLLALQILRLRNNKFNGTIPSLLCLLFTLQILDLAVNNLTGSIPRCVRNLNGMVLKQSIDQLDTEQDVAIAQWDEENVMQVLKGRDLEYTTNLRLVVNMDLSCNNLVGLIPEELTFLSGLLGLNLSDNRLSGTIPEKIGDLKSLFSLDFSKNQLSGTIPKGMSTLTSLSHLNMSYNNLWGTIPTGNQLQTLLDPSIYVGNPLLCGPPLPKQCSGDEPSGAPRTTGYEDKDAEDESEKVWFYIVIMLGFATGFWVVLGVLLLKKSWRRAYFQLVDETKDWIYVAIAVNVARVKKESKHINK